MSIKSGVNPHFNYIKKMLHIQDSKIIITNIEDKIIKGINTLLVHISREIDPTSCPYCNSTYYISHNSYVRTLKFPDISGYNTLLKYKQKRYKCKECNKTFNEPCNLANSSSTIANSLKLKIIEECKYKQSFKDISKSLNISEPMVSKIFIDHVSISRHRLTETLCFDEFRATTDAGKYAFIIGDPVSGEIIDIIKSRTKDFLQNYFNSVPFEEREKVKYIVTDLFEPYRSIIHLYFPNALHIADRFHWIRQATEAFNKLRIRIMKNYQNLGEDIFKGKYNKYSTYYYQLKKYWKLLNKNKYTTSDSFFNKTQYDYYTKKELTINDLIERLVNSDRDLEEGYTLLQSIYEIAKHANSANIIEKLEDWIIKVRSSEYSVNEFKSVVDCFINWMDEIANSFIINPKTKTRMTNGFIEGKNNICKTIKRIGFGYSNFDTFRSRVLYITNKNIPIKN